MLEESMKTTSKMRIEKIKKVLMSLTKEQKFSVNGFWKLKKSSQYNKQMCSSIETENGTEIYGKEMILNEYKKEFEERLRPREMGEKLQRYQKMTNELSKMYTDIAEKERIDDFEMEEIEKVLDTMDIGKSTGTDLIPADIFIKGGKEITQMLLNAMNSVKNGENIPKQWNNVLISTIYKNKGKHKRLENYRGIFLTQVLSKIYERLNKLRINEKN